MQKLALDIETIGLKPYGGTVWVITYSNGRSVKIEHSNYGIKKLPPALVADLADPKIQKILHNAEFDATYLKLVLGVVINNIWDTRLAEQIILGTSVPRNSKNESLNIKYSASLKYTLARYQLATLNKEPVKGFIDRSVGIAFTEEELNYAKKDTEFLIPLQAMQEYLLKRDGGWEVMLLEMQVLNKVIDMRVRGIGFNQRKWIRLAEQTKNTYESLMNNLPTGINWNSEKQVKAFLRDKGINLATFADLDKVAGVTKSPLLRNFIAARSLHKSVTSYGMNWITDKFMDGDGRIRAGYTQILNTGRMAMNTPNLHQLPAEGQHRAAFVPAKGNVFVIGDFSGQELGIMAAAAKEEIWMKAMMRGDDVHSLTASMLFSKEWGDTEEKGCAFPAKCKCAGHARLRKPTKILNFMLAYGGGPQRFSESTNTPLKESKKIVFKYKRVVNKLTKWLDNNAKQAVRTRVSYSADPYKRRRILIEPEDWMIANQGKNNPIQAAGANMIKLALISIPSQYNVVLTIHDEIVLEVPKNIAKLAVRDLKIVMEQAANYIIGIKKGQRGLIYTEPRIATNLLKQ